MVTNAQSPLVGRDDTMVALREALAATAGGRGACAVITGPPGIGKSRLLAALVAEAGSAGLAVAPGRATELDRAVPSTTLLGTLRRQLPGLDLSRRNDDEWRFGWIGQVEEAIEEYVRRQPLLIVIDDAHWADELSALALRLLVPALAASPVYWLFSRRPVPVRSPAQDTLDWLIGEGAGEYALAPLTEAAVEQLCGNVLGARPDATVLALAARASGNPFLVEQLLRSLRDADQLTFTDGDVSVAGHDLPSGFLTAVDRRLRGLTPGTRILLEVGSVFGRPFTLHAATRVTGQAVGELAAAAAEAIGAGLLIDRGRHLAFHHDLLREAVYHHLPGPVRAARHRVAAAVLRAEGQPVVEVAEHLIRAGQRDDQAVAVLREAAAQVAADAPGTAADLLLRMLDLLDESDPARPGLVGEAVRRLAAAGRLAEARQQGEAVLHIGMPAAAEAALLLGLAEAYKHSGRNDLVVELTGRALARPGLPDPTAATLLAIRAHALLQVDDPEAADAAAADAVERGTAAAVPEAVVFGGVARSVAARARGALEQALAYARMAVDLADESGGGARHQHPRLWWGRALCALDQFTDAEQVYAAGQREAERLSSRWSQPLWHHYRGSLVAARGELTDAQAWAEAGLRVAGQLTALQMALPLHALLTRLAVRRGALEEAQAQLEAAKRLIDAGVTAASDELWWAEAMLQEARGCTPTTLGALAALYGRQSHRLLLLANEPDAVPTLVRLARRAGDHDAAAAVVTAIQRLADANPTVASITGAAAHAAGLLHWDGDRLLAAVEHLRTSPRPLALASAWEDLAAWQRAAGQAQRATASLREAYALYRRSGATRDVARISGRLATLDGRRPAAPHRPPAGSAELTESELRVVRLVAEGMTNREIAGRLHLSPHTVDSHLRHVFAKLGINSRVKLTRLYLAQSLPGRVSPRSSGESPRG